MSISIINQTLTYIRYIIYIPCRSASSISTTSPEIIFNNLNMNDNLTEYNNLIGALKGNVQFAQNHIIPSTPSETTGQYWAHLVSLRDTLVLYKPLAVDNIDGNADVLLEVLDKDGKIIEWSKTNKNMMKPNELPKPTEQVDVTETDEKYFKDFVSNAVYDKTIMGAKTKSLEGDKTGEKISSLLRGDVKDGKGLKIKTFNGWGFAKHIYLPNDDDQINKKFVTIESNSYYVVSYIYYKDLNDFLRIAVLWRGGTLHFMNVNGKWIQYSDLAYRRIRYGNNFWSLKLPSRVITPEISMKFTYDGTSGKLDNIVIGAPNDLLVNTIDIGFLTPYRNEFTFQQDPKWHSQYFQTVPISRLIVNQYEAITFEKVVLSDGTEYTMDKGSSDEADGYTGDMRGVGRRLITMGINFANYGIHSIGGYSTPRPCLQMTANNMRGKYASSKPPFGSTEIVTHGFTGGGAVADLFESIGNEFSHELQHTWGKPSGVPNYNQSPKNQPEVFATQTLHRPANEKQSTWGWDSIKNVFIPNFKKVATGEEICLKYKTGKNDEQDKKCQRPFNQMYMFGKDTMGGGEPFYPSTNFFTMYSPYTSYRAQEFFEWKAVFDGTSKTGMRKWVPECNCMAEWKSDEDIGDHDANKNYPRQPTVQGVAVSTLLGFYDPQGKIKSYIYPALHGAYGNVFQQSSQKELDKSPCVATIINDEGEVKKYALKGVRTFNNEMNQFHINVEETFKPKTITLKCNGQTLDSREISKPSKKLIYTVNGNG